MPRKCTVCQNVMISFLWRFTFQYKSHTTQVLMAEARCSKLSLWTRNTHHSRYSCPQRENRIRMLLLKHITTFGAAMKRMKRRPWPSLSQRFSTTYRDKAPIGGGKYKGSGVGGTGRCWNLPNPVVGRWYG